MANQKIRNNLSTVTDIVIFMLIAMAIFYGSFYYMADNVDSANVTLDPRYDDVFDNLSSAQDDLLEDIRDVQDSAEEIKEAENTAFAVWNGLKGLGTTVKVMFNLVGTSEFVISIFIGFFDLFPAWVGALVLIGLVAVVVFIIIGKATGEPRM